MIVERWPEVSRVLDEVLDRPEEEWPALVARLCASDASLRREVEAVLAGHARIEGFLATPPSALAADALDSDASDLVGRRVGPYRVVRPIARGGMGRVVLAERADGAFEQTVALKLLGTGADAPDTAWRFRVERQILANLTHPNIAHLYDGGVTDDGRPWLAMEYVEGTTIDRWVEAHGLRVPARLELFLTVAGAVAYAHRNLVIHRDLKAGNIMVTASGEPKLLDFGIAKLLDDPEDGASHVTRTGRRWMTPAYAAPEQIRGEAATTATDVYQLGAVLYELLTGRPPFELEQRNVHAIEDAVLTRDPVRPSQVAATTTRPETWTRALRGDLDAIVLKALRKEPERRYGSVEAMADDVRRHLARRPVRAREGTVAYQARRFVTRHRVAVGVAAAFATLLLASAAALAVAQAATARERDRATAEAAKSAQVTDYLVGLFDASDPGEALGDTITARELLERGVDRAAALDDQPTVQATLLGVTGRVYVNLGEYTRGVELLRRSVEIQRAEPDPDEEQLTRTIFDLAATLELQEQYEPATQLYREVVARTAGRPDDRSLLLSAQFSIGSTLHAGHRMAAADSAFALWEAMVDSLPPTPTPELADAQIWLGRMMQYRSEYPRAERMLRHAVATNRAVYGEGHPEVGDALNALASALLSARTRVEAADSVTAEALALQRALGPEPRRAAINAMANRAELLEARGALLEAERLVRDARTVAASAFGEDHLVRGRLTARLAHVLGLQGRHGEAEELYRGLYASEVEERGPDYHFTVVLAVRLAETLAAQREFPEAERLFLASYETFRRDRGEDDVWTTTTAARIERMYQTWGKPDLAARYAGHGPAPPPGRE